MCVYCFCYNGVCAVLEGLCSTLLCDRRTARPLSSICSLDHPQMLNIKGPKEQGRHLQTSHLHTMQKTVWTKSYSGLDTSSWKHGSLLIQELHWISSPWLREWIVWRSESVTVLKTQRSWRVLFFIFISLSLSISPILMGSSFLVSSLWGHWNLCL